MQCTYCCVSGESTGLCQVKDIWARLGCESRLLTRIWFQVALVMQSYHLPVAEFAWVHQRQRVESTRKDRWHHRLLQTSDRLPRPKTWLPTRGIYPDNISCLPHYLPVCSSRSSASLGSTLAGSRRSHWW